MSTCYLTQYALLVGNTKKNTTLFSFWDFDCTTAIIESEQPNNNSTSSEKNHPTSKIKKYVLILDFSYCNSFEIRNSFLLLIYNFKKIPFPHGIIVLEY